eukprot:681557-Pleurochrysis_carterae.AAC.2
MAGKTRGQSERVEGRTESKAEPHRQSRTGVKKGEVGPEAIRKRRTWEEHWDGRGWRECGEGDWCDEGAGGKVTGRKWLTG